MDVFVARQPIFDIDKKVIGYELLYRDSVSNFFDFSVGATKATSIVLTNTYLTFGIDKLLQDKKAYVNFDKVLIINDVPLLIDKDKIVIEILQDIVPDKLFISKLIKLKEKGYTIALDDFTLQYTHEEIIELVDILKVDFRISRKPELQEIIEIYKHKNKIFLAEKLETKEDFEYAASIGYDLFQGYFFSKPVVMTSKKIGSIEINYIRIINEISKMEPDFKKISSIIETDIDMSYKLLKMVNTFELSYQVNSIPYALSLLGIDELKKWISLLMIGSVSFSKPTEVLRLSIFRSKFAEIIAENSSFKEKKHELALVGLFSTIDVLLNRNIDSIFSELCISDNIRLAIKLDPKSEFYHIYKLVIDYEKGNWKDIEIDLKSLKIYKNIPYLYTEAVRITDELVDLLNI